MTAGGGGQGPLAGKVALVTGGSRGLGRSMVLAFADAGADVVVASRKLDSCQAVAAEVEAKGRRALPVACHVGHWDEIDGLVEQAYDAFGHVDVLVNNAGMSPLYPDLTSVTEELWDKVLGVNLKGPFRLTALVGTRMAAGRVWRVHHQRLEHRVHPPATAHAALRRRQVRPQHPHRGLRQGLRADACGSTASWPDRSSPTSSKAWGPAVLERGMPHHALGRAGEPDEIVGAALYFATDASSYTTGAILRVDGGIP